MCSNPDNTRALGFAQAMSQIDDLKIRGYGGVVLTGGEPSLSPIVEDVVRYAVGQQLSIRMISNGSRLSDKAIAEAYVDAGLKHFHLSMHSCTSSVHDRVTTVAGSFDRVCIAAENLAKCGAVVDINVTITKMNADHLHDIVAFVLARFAFVSHMVFNNLDTSMGRAKQDSSVRHRLCDMEVSLHRALRLLRGAGRTFRVERVPLCYMSGFEDASTETRKIVKGEERLVNFLDDKGVVRQTDFRHGKPQACGKCSLNNICAGLFEMGQGYDPAELAPVFVDPCSVIQAVMGG